jgi:hypothetical protein
MRHLRGMGWVRPRHEIEEALAIQRLAITASCKAYDLGERWEAIRLATAVFTVVHDAGKKYISILSQLGLRAKLRFVASGFEYSPRNVLRETHLVSTRIYSDGTAEYLPLIQSDMADMGRLLQFREWWEREIIFRDGQFHLTRRNLVFNLRSQDGGAHFDPELRDPNYVRFAKEQLTSH